MIHLTPDVWLQIVAYIAVIVGLSFKFGQMEAKYSTKAELREKVTERNQVVDRVYSRFDEFKNDVHEHFVKKDMCNQLHITSKDELKRIDEDYKTFRHEIRNQIQMLVDKIDQLRELITKK